MFVNAVRVVASGATLSFGLLLPFGAHAQSRNDRVEQVDPFTHVAYIAAESDPKSIRFEKARYVHVPTKLVYTYHTSYCESAASREPGGSAHCPATKEDGLVPAYELTYSFHGPVRPSNRNWQTQSNFHVYFRPEELSSELRNAVESGKIDRAAVAARFNVNLTHEMINKKVVDAAESTFCDTTLIDGLWAQSDRNCVPQIVYTTVSSPSSHLTVTVAPSPQSGQVTAATKPDTD